MHIFNRLLIICTFLPLTLGSLVQAQDDTAATRSRLTVGGYGEAVYYYNFFSDSPKRYRHPDVYADAPGHGRVDLPHAVIMLGYDFGHGWTVGTEIEFEHGGTEAAVEVEGEEAVEFEREIERGGEVALEQFWVQKSFSKYLNVRAGHIVVPVGMTNNNHTPNTFFGVFRPEGENTILPCTWHETGLSVWGQAGPWRYEAQLLPALNSRMMDSYGWAHNASASPYEFRPANNLAGALRVDWTGVKGLRLSASGYVGNTFDNDSYTDIYPATSPFHGVKGTLMIGAFDFAYRNRYLTVRGNVDYGFLGDDSIITMFNNTRLPNSADAPYPHTRVGEQAWAAGIEAGVDVLAFFHAKKLQSKKLYLFGRYDHYDSYVPFGVLPDIEEAERELIVGGINYYPLPEIAVKAEGGVRLRAKQFNREPYVAVGITWTGFFKR